MTEEEAIELARAEREDARTFGLSSFSELEIYPDFTHAWAFVAGDHEDSGMAIGDGYCWLGDPELPYGLIARLAKWQRKFGIAPFDPDFFVVMDWESFHAEGLALATEVKRALGNAYTVRYAKAFEDRNRTAPITMEIANLPFIHHVEAMPDVHLNRHNIQ